MVSVYRMDNTFVGNMYSLSSLKCACYREKQDNETGLSLHGEMQGRTFMGEYPISYLLTLTDSVQRHTDRVAYI